MAAVPRFIHRLLDELVIEDEAVLSAVSVVGDLARILLHDRYRFRVLPTGLARWDRALLLNLAYWGAREGGDVLVHDVIDADVVAHVGWHHLAARALGGDAPLSAEALFLGEAIASAFDIYLVGRLLTALPDATFLATQVPAMSDVCSEAGLDEAGFEALLAGVAADPSRAFEELRALLFDVSVALFAAADAEAALAVLARVEGHRFAPLLHRFELSTWVLYARAFAPTPLETRDERARAVDEALRASEDALAWLVNAWVLPALP